MRCMVCGKDVSAKNLGPGQPAQSVQVDLV